VTENCMWGCYDWRINSMVKYAIIARSQPHCLLECFDNSVSLNLVLWNKGVKMIIGKITFEMRGTNIRQTSNGHRSFRHLYIQVEDIDGEVKSFDEEFVESDAIDTLSEVFKYALRIFHEEYNKQGGSRAVQFLKWQG
jgi:hypothetical protein